MVNSTKLVFGKANSHGLSKSIFELMEKSVQGLVGMVFCCLLLSCGDEQKQAAISTKQPPNVLWIYVEDLNPFFSSYGMDSNPTPNIDYLAENGVLFEKAFTPAPVCSPARSAIISSTMPTTFGTHNHHSSRTVEDAVFLPEGFHTVPELFKKAGYHTFNHGKDDYNFIYDRKRLYADEVGVDFWYTFAGKGDWLAPLSKEKPFFGQIQLNGGKWGLSQSYPKMAKDIVPIDRDLVELPPYYPDIPSVREDWARHYDAARKTDLEVKELLGQLRAKGLLENTYVFFFSDHGYKGIRHKQFVYDGGIHIPLIIAYFGTNSKISKSTRRKDLVSGIDIGTTSLALANIDIPETMEGKNIFAPDFKRDYIVATRDRCDFSIDRIRAIRSEKFKYILNYMPHRSYTQPSYRDKRPEFVDIKKAYDAGELNAVQAKYWLPNKPQEEFFDLENDPHEINNLAKDPAFQDQLTAHRKYLNDWLFEFGDKGEEGQNLYSLKFIYDRWGDRCVNEEYEQVKNLRISNTPARNLKKG